MSVPVQSMKIPISFTSLFLFGIKQIQFNRHIIQSILFKVEFYHLLRKQKVQLLRCSNQPGYRNGNGNGNGKENGNLEKLKPIIHRRNCMVPWAICTHQHLDPFNRKLHVIRAIIIIKRLKTLISNTNEPFFMS